VSLEELKKGRIVIGSKQVKKAVTKGSARKVYLADDAEPHIVGPLKEMCHQHAVEVELVGTMETLGNACGIEVGSAAVALLID
jgi:large subunit ribosomal protein L7A